MTEMKNICGKIPKDLHEKVREEIELTESSTQKFIQQVIEEHFERLAGKGEMSMGTARTIAVQVSEELFQRLKTVIAKKGMKQKDFLIQIIEEHWKRQSRMAEQRQHGRNGTCNRRIWNRRDSTGRGNRTGRRKQSRRTNRMVTNRYREINRRYEKIMPPVLSAKEVDNRNHSIF